MSCHLFWVLRTLVGERGRLSMPQKWFLRQAVGDEVVQCWREWLRQRQRRQWLRWVQWRRGRLEVATRGCPTLASACIRRPTKWRRTWRCSRRTIKWMRPCRRGRFLGSAATTKGALFVLNQRSYSPSTAGITANFSSRPRARSLLLPLLLPSPPLLWLSLRAALRRRRRPLRTA